MEHEELKNDLIEVVKKALDERNIEKHLDLDTLNTSEKTRGICAYFDYLTGGDDIIACTSSQFRHCIRVKKIFIHLVTKHYMIYRGLSAYYWKPNEWEERLEFLERLLQDLKNGDCDESIRYHMGLNC